MLRKFLGVLTDRVIEEVPSHQHQPLGLGIVRSAADGICNFVYNLVGSLTSGLFNVNKSSQGGSSLLTPFESSVYQFGFDANWEIDFFGGRRRALEAATADFTAVGEARRDTLVSLLAEVARNYSELRGFQKRLDIIHQNINLQQDSLDLTRARSDAGLGTQFDVERQSAQLDSTRAIVPQLEAAEIQTIHRLGVLLGEEPGALLTELTGTKPLPTIPPAVPVGLPGDLLKRRPDIREADARVAAETARVGVARADLFPKILLTGAGGQSFLHGVVGFLSAIILDQGPGKGVPGINVMAELQFLLRQSEGFEQMPVVIGKEQCQFSVVNLFI